MLIYDLMAYVNDSIGRNYVLKIVAIYFTKNLALVFHNKYFLLRESLIYFTKSVALILEV
jgi:hypothetical protein